MIADEDPDFQLAGPRMTVWSKYLAMHARKQLSFGKFTNWWYTGIHAFRVQICGGSVLLFSLFVSLKYVKFV